VPPGAETAEAKQALRDYARARRRLIHDQAGEAAGEVAAARFLDSIPRNAKSVVALSMPIADEFDTRPLIEKLAAGGTPCALPVIVKAGAPLQFRAYHPGDVLLPGRLGILEPGPEAEAVTPTVFIVPLLAFDREGFRLGYGGGYYDRTLRAARAARSVLAVGLGFAAQEVEEVPHEPSDEALDWIVTEREIIRPHQGGRA